MMNVSINTLLLVSRIVLAFLWIFTGLTSIFFYPELGFKIITEAGFSSDTAKLFIYSGSVIDVALGLWVLTSWKIKLCYLAQIILIISYSILLTIFDASYWLHPFGPLTKNLPIIILVMILLHFEQTAK